MKTFSFLVMKVQSTRYAILLLLGDASAVIHLLVMPQEHLIEQALPLETQLIVRACLHLSFSTYHQNSISKLEVIFISIIGHYCYLLASLTLREDCSKKTKIIKKVLLVENQIVNIIVQGSRQLYA